MNKAYRHVYKDGIGWVAIAENASCVSSSKGSGTVVEKSGVEVLKNFFDLRNSVVLNNGFLLKGLFAATLFCGVFVGDLRAADEKDIAKIQNNGTVVYTENDGYRMEKVLNPDGSIGFKGKLDKSILDTADEYGVMTVGDSHFVVPTGTFNKLTSTNIKENPVFFEVKKENGKWRGLTFYELWDKRGRTTGTGKPGLSIQGNRESVIYDEKEKKWYVHNQVGGDRLYPAIKESDGSLNYVSWEDLIQEGKNIPIGKNKNAKPKIGPEGYYRTSGFTGNEIDRLGIKVDGSAILTQAERLSLVGKDGISTTPQKYTQDDETNGKIPAGRNVGDNKDGKIRLGNVARAMYDDEAVNLGQLNEKLEKIPYVSINASEKGPGSNYDSDGATGKDAIAIGQNAQAKAKNVVSIGESAGKTKFDNGSGSVFIGRNAGINSAIIDPQSSDNWGSVYIGQDAGNGSKGDGNLYLGSKTGFQHDGSQNIFLGDGARNLKDGEKYNDTKLHTQGNRNIAIGNQYVHDPKKVNTDSNAIDDTIAIGTGTRVGANRAIAIGSAYDYKDKGKNYIATVADGENSIALGSGIVVKSDNGVAIGFGSKIDTNEVKDAVALGSYSQASRKALKYKTKDVYLGDKNDEVAETAKRTKGAISVGNDGLGEKFTRQITNVAAGTTNTDAVNVAQLKALQNEGFYTEANLTASGNTNRVKHQLGSIIKVGGTSNLLIDKLSGENLATSINNDGSINLLMAKTPKFDDINISKDGKGGDYTNLTQWLKKIESSSSTSTGDKIKYFSVKSKEEGNENNDGAKGNNSIAIGPNAKAGDSSVAIGLSARTGGEGEIDGISYKALGELRKDNINKYDDTVKKLDETKGEYDKAEKRYEDAEVKYQEAVRNYDNARDASEKKKYESEKEKYELAMNRHKSSMNRHQSKMDGYTKLKDKYGKLEDTYGKMLSSYEATYKYDGRIIKQAEYDELIKKLDKNQQSALQKTRRYVSSNAFYENSVAIGNDAQALSSDAVAIGNGAKVIANGGVAIGQGSVSHARTTEDLKGYEPLAADIKKDGPNIYYPSTWEATDQPFSVGDERGMGVIGAERITRQITGVAAGKKDTDAVNVAQLKQIGIHVEGDIGKRGAIQSEGSALNNTLKIKTDGKWENSETKIVYTGKNLETRFTPTYFAGEPLKKDIPSKFEIAMTDTPRFKSITIADDNVMKNQEDKSPIELKKFDDNTNNNTIGFAGKGDSAIKLTNLADGTIGENSKDAITGGQIQKIIKGGLKFTANSGEHTAELGSQISIKGATANTDWTKFDNGENIMTNIDTDGNIVVGLSKDLKNITSIENGGKTYTFGDANLGDTSVITNKDLTTELKNYVTTGDDKTAKVTVDGKGLKVTDDSAAHPNQPTYTLSLVEKDIKDIAGTTNLTADLDKKADKNAGNLEAGDVAKWQEKLGNGSNNPGSTGLITGDTLNKSLEKYSQNSDKTAEVSVEGDGLKLDSDKTTNVAKYKLSLDKDVIKKLAGTDDLDDLKNKVENKADIDAENVKDDNLVKWQKKLGVSELNTAINNFNTNGMFKVSSKGANPVDIVPNAVVDFTAGVGNDTNLIVSHEKTNNGVKVNYTLNKELKSINSIGGNGKKVSFTNDGVDFGGAKIKNVAEGDADTDGVNLKQVRTLIANVGTTNLVEVQTNSPMVYILDKEGKPRVQLVRDKDKNDNNKMKFFRLDDKKLEHPITDGNGNFTDGSGEVGDQIKISTIHPGYGVADKTKITNVKAGNVTPDSLEAINGSQLHASNKAIAEILGGGSTLDDNGVVKKPTYNITGTDGNDKPYDTIGGALEELNKFNKNFTEKGLFSVSKDSATPLNIKPNENISFIAGSNLALKVEKGDSDKGAKITYSLKDELEGITSIASKTSEPLKISSNNQEFYFNNTDPAKKERNVATIGDLASIDGNTTALIKAVAGDNKLNSNGTISQNADSAKTPFDPIKTASNPNGDTKSKTLFETVNNTIAAINEGFKTGANFDADNISTKGKEVKLQLGSTIKITGTSAESDINKLSGKNLATSINKDGSINLLMSRAPRFDSVNIGGDENKPDSGIKIAQDGKDGNTLIFTGEDGNKGVTLKGVDGINGKDGKDLLASSSDDIRKALGVKNGIDGKDGKDGKTGKDAVLINNDGKLAKVVDDPHSTDPEKTTKQVSPFTGIKTVKLDNDGKPVIGTDGKPKIETTKDQPKTYLEATNEIIDAVNKGFFTEANLTASADTNRVKHQLGSTIKVGGTSNLSIDKLSGENLATSINKDGSINLLMSKAPRFDSVNIGGNENDPDSGIKIGKDGEDSLKFEVKDGKKVTLKNIKEIKNGDKSYTFDDDEKTGVVTKSQLEEVRNLAKGGSVGNIEFITDDKETTKLANNKLNIKGDGNIKTSKVEDGEIKISLGDEISFGGEITNPDGTKTKTPKITLGKDGLTTTGADGKAGPSITADGIDGGNKKLTNLASGLDGRSLDEIKADIKKANGDKAKMPKEVGNAATIGDLANVDTKVTNVQNITNNLIGGNVKDENGNDVKFVNDNGNLTEAGKEALTTNAVSGQNKIENTNIIQAINNINKQGTKFFHVNDGTQVVKDSNKDDKDSSAASKGGIAIGMKASVGKDARDAIAIGSGSQALAENTIAIGNGNVVKGKNSGAIGDPSIIDAKNSYSVGNNNKIEASTTSNNFILGNNAEITSSNSVALGESTKVSVEGGVALGARSVSSREIGKESGYDISTDSASTSKDATWLSTAGAVAVGDETQGITRQITGVAAGSQDTDAVNVAQLKAVQKISQSAQWISVNNENNLPKSQAGKGDVKGYTGNNSVVIGPGSTTKIGSTAEGKPLYRENTVSVGGVTKDKNGKNVLIQRTISNVAPGVLNSDAATMGQLRAGLNDVYGKLGEYKKDASAGTASAMAIGNMPQATIPGKGMVSLGSGFYDGQSAMAIGLSKMSDDGKWVFKGSASYDSQEKAGAALSVGFHF